MIKNKTSINAVDLFCGAGGLTRGLEKSGINVLLGIDIDPACRYPYEKNNNSKFLLKSIDDVTPEEIKTHYNSNAYSLLAGCAPCQTFSSYNPKSNSSDKRWWLLLQFARLIEEVSPELVTMENVPGLIKQDVFNKFISKLKSNDYNVSYSIVQCEQYGLPQTRRRLVLLASKYGKISLITPKEFNSKPSTVRQAIGKLNTLKAGSIDSMDKLHQSSGLSEINIKRIQHSLPGGTWRDWPDELIADCHKKKSGKTYPGVYGRMEWDKPSPTLTTQFFGFGNGRFGHPEQNRAISLREGAILQSFPKYYKFVPPGEPYYVKTLGRLIGNAVPVKLGEIIGKSILKHVNGYK